MFYPKILIIIIVPASISTVPLVSFCISTETLETSFLIKSHITQHRGQQKLSEL